MVVMFRVVVSLISVVISIEFSNSDIGIGSLRAWDLATEVQ